MDSCGKSCSTLREKNEPKKRVVAEYAGFAVLPKTAITQETAPPKRKRKGDKLGILSVAAVLSEKEAGKAGVASVAIASGELPNKVIDELAA